MAHEKRVQWLSCAFLDCWISPASLEWGAVSGLAPARGTLILWEDGGTVVTGGERGRAAPCCCRLANEEVTSASGEGHRRNEALLGDTGEKGTGSFARGFHGGHRLGMPGFPPAGKPGDYGVADTLPALPAR